MKLSQLDNFDTAEKESLSSLDDEQRKSQQIFEQDEGSSSDYTIQQQELFRIKMNLRVLHALNGYTLTPDENGGANKILDGWIVCLRVWMLGLGLL